MNLSSIQPKSSVQLPRNSLNGMPKRSSIQSETGLTTSSRRSSDVSAEVLTAYLSSFGIQTLDGSSRRSSGSLNGYTLSSSGSTVLSNASDFGPAVEEGRMSKEAQEALRWKINSFQGFPTSKMPDHPYVNMSESELRRELDLAKQRRGTKEPSSYISETARINLLEVTLDAMTRQWEQRTSLVNS